MKRLFTLLGAIFALSILGNFSVDSGMLYYVSILIASLTAISLLLEPFLEIVDTFKDRKIRRQRKAEIREIKHTNKVNDLKKDIEIEVKEQENIDIIDIDSSMDLDTTEKELTEE